MNILQLHGIYSHAGAHWQQRLHDQLVQQGHTVLMPNLSNPEHPDRMAWLEEVRNLVGNIDPNQLVIVGHSLGVPTALDYIEALTTPLRSLISVSGFAVDYGSELNSYFMQARTIDFKSVNAHLGHAQVFFGDDDPYVTQSALQSLADNLHVKPHIINKGGHLNSESGFMQFPVLLKAVQVAIQGA
jgi:predicted alpha/beta hydrolase family esterase